MERADGHTATGVQPASPYHSDSQKELVEGGLDVVETLTDPQNGCQMPQIPSSGCANESGLWTSIHLVPLSTPTTLRYHHTPASQQSCPLQTNVLTLLVLSF